MYIKVRFISLIISIGGARDSAPSMAVLICVTGLCFTFDFSRMLAPQLGSILLIGSIYVIKATFLRGHPISGQNKSLRAPPSIMVLDITLHQ